MNVLQRALRLSVIDAFFNMTTGILRNTHLDIHLFKNDLDPTPDNVDGDFIEADFDGYAFVAGLSMGAAGYDDNGNGVAVCTTTVQIASSGSTTPNVIYGYRVKDGTKWYAERFAIPQIIAKAGDMVVFTPRFGYPVQTGGVQEA